jgi:hypothetical protein
MPDLLIQITKRRDGSVVLRCIRADGSVTWQHQTGTHAAFFPTHDLTHYAVEDTLGHDRGFYGLLADGWNITDFGAPWPRGRAPEVTIVSELIVGFLDAERASGTRWAAEDFNDKAALHRATHGGSWHCSLTDDDLARIRARRSELFERWANLAPGETMELAFDRGRPAA